MGEFELVGLKDFPTVRALFESAKQKLQADGVVQWNWFYPNAMFLRYDIRRASMLGLRMGEDLVGVVTVDTLKVGFQKSVAWMDMTGKPAGIHRLVVSVSHHGKGFGAALVSHAIDLAQKGEHTSIRIEVSTTNPAALRLYEKFKFQIVGETKYPLNPARFFAMERSL